MNNDIQLRQLEAQFNQALHNVLGDKSPEELRKLDCFTVNAEFYSEQAKQKQYQIEAASCFLVLLKSFYHADRLG